MAIKRPMLQRIAAVIAASVLVFAFPHRPWWVIPIVVAVLGVSVSLIEKPGKVTLTDAAGWAVITGIVAVLARVLF